ncbi:hypothetical protein FB45DRAFT_979722 [Roridomyces roridus]|uniref:Uncharacterized protein n=1 Tax=Roridomyces roridus TaxID=1738132 RepID=A0AAD7BQH5_9AGAR|nr:hypothetical protein FB45DRAFT_979722 [Roridomyces roridus]
MISQERYVEFLRTVRQWLHISMLKRAGRGLDPSGIAGTQPGYCIRAETYEFVSRFLYALFLAIDANFRLKRKDVSSEEKDPGFGNGWAFFGDVHAYMQHLRTHWNDKQERSHCVAHDAVDKPDRESRGTSSSGAWSELMTASRYINMDWIFFRSIAGTQLVRLFVSYDIACQWHIHLWERLRRYQDATLMLDGRGKFFHLPAHIEACNLKFSFNLTRDVGMTDGEGPERGWSNSNALARSTKEMGPGARRDTLDAHFNDWNHKKIIALETIRKLSI